MGIVFYGNDHYSKAFESDAKKVLRGVSDAVDDARSDPGLNTKRMKKLLSIVKKIISQGNKTAGDLDKLTEKLDQAWDATGKVYSMKKSSDIHDTVERQVTALINDLPEVDVGDLDVEEARELGETIVAARKAIDCYGKKKKRRR